MLIESTGEACYLETLGHRWPDLRAQNLTITSSVIDASREHLETTPTLAADLQGTESEAH